VQPGSALVPVPYAAVERDLAHPGTPARVGLTAGADGRDVLVAQWDGRRVGLRVGGSSTARLLVSRRHGRPGRGTAPDGLALTLTGPTVTAWTRERAAWVARARVDLTDPAGPAGPGGLPVHDEGWLAGLAPLDPASRVGRFGQLGLRDLRVASHADGTAYRLDDARVLLTATSAGVGGFGSGHASVWALDPATLTWEHRGDLYFRRPAEHATPGVYGDHACHLVRDDGAWLVATSTWGDFDRVRRPAVGATLARSSADLTQGAHVLDTERLHLPTTGLTSVGCWDPQLVRDPGTGTWRVAFVSASRWFRFHPVVAEGPSLESLRLVAAAPERTATEGPVLVRTTDGWRLLASDGRDGGRRHPPGYPVLDPARAGLPEVGRLRAAYPSNLPWPSLVPHDGGWLMVGFDGTATGGPLPGYGTHGDVVVQRSV